MHERRRFSRLLSAENATSAVICGGVKEDARLMDVSAGGMRISLARQAAVGEDLYGKLKILPEIGPFFVKGRVLRVTEKESGWEAAVQFKSISTVPFLTMNMAHVI
jgi:hypothetical protein